jgi:ubiquinone/menaquinone biosynthesis C-methylase UbiE
MCRGPNDERQNEGLDLTHHMLALALDGKLHFAPIGDNPQRVVDIGTGTGIWAIDFADQFPSAEVIGTDLSPIQPSWIPPNCKFELDDAQLPWTFPDNYFDFVHIRCLMGSIKDWPALYKEVYRCLKPGGWFEHVDYSIDTKCDDDSFPEWSPWIKWYEIFAGAGDKMGQTFRLLENDNMKNWLKEGGFENRDHYDWKLPMSGWPKDPKWKEVGLINQLIVEGSLEGYTLHMLSKVHGWDYSDVQTFLVSARKALRDKSQHAYFSAQAVWGQKPGGEA